MKQRSTHARSRWTASVLAVLVVTVCAPVLAAEPGLAGHRTATGGHVPEGIWVLNEDRSRKLKPVSQTLWIIKDDGKQLAWVSVETDRQHQVKINSWNGFYEGEAVAATGHGFKARLTSTAPGTMRTYGEVPGVGPYEENCAVMAGGKRMVCNGFVTGADGKPQRWIEDFDWQASSPSFAKPK